MDQGMLKILLWIGAAVLLVAFLARRRKRKAAAR